MSLREWVSKQLCIAYASFTCNLYCRYCHNPPTGEKKTLDCIINLVKREKADAISLEGQGEPLTNPDILKLIKELKKNRTRHIMISTNGINLSNMELLEKLSKEVDFFVINIPSHIKEIYNYLTRSVKYELIIKGLNNLKEMKILKKVRIFHIIMKPNYKYLSDFVEWIKNNYSDVALINFVFVRNKGRVNNSKEIVPKYSEVSPYIRIALGKAKLYGIKAIIQNYPICMLPNFEGFSFEFQRWKRGDDVFERGVEMPLVIDKCKKCTLRPACCGARKDYVKIYGTSELKTSKLDLNKIKPERF